MVGLPVLVVISGVVVPSEVVVGVEISGVVVPSEYVVGVPVLIVVSGVVVI